VDFASWVFPDLKLDWLVRETKKTLPFELNFLLEGKNSEKTAALMKHLPWLNVIKRSRNRKLMQIIAYDFI
jgi:predicted unusual protein kinase regulating ubiquinone biosynthesis (AarF/ABC1/UbiB family)